MFVSILLTLSRGWRDSEMAIWMSSGKACCLGAAGTFTFALPMLVIAMVLSTVLSLWAESGARLSTGGVLEARDELSVLPRDSFRNCARPSRCTSLKVSTWIDGTIKNVFVFADDPNGQWLVCVRCRLSTRTRPVTAT